MATSVKKRLSPDQVVERLSMLLSDDPSMAVAIDEIYRRNRDSESRRAALIELAIRRGHALPSWI